MGVKALEVAEVEEREQAYLTCGRPLAEEMVQDLGGLAWVDRDCKYPMDEEESESQADWNRKMFQGTLAGGGSKQGWANLVDNQVARPLLALAGKTEVEQPPLWVRGGAVNLAFAEGGDHCRLHLVDRARQSDKLLVFGKLRHEDLLET